MSSYNDQFDEWNKYRAFTHTLEYERIKTEYKEVFVDLTSPKDVRDLANELEYLLEQGWDWGGFDTDDRVPYVYLYRKTPLPQEDVDMMTKWLEDHPLAKYPPGHKKRGEQSER